MHIGYIYIGRHHSGSSISLIKMHFLYVNAWTGTENASTCN